MSADSSTLWWQSMALDWSTHAMRVSRDPWVYRWFYITLRLFFITSARAQCVSEFVFRCHHIQINIHTSSGILSYCFFFWYREITGQDGVYAAFTDPRKLPALSEAWPAFSWTDPARSDAPCFAWSHFSPAASEAWSSTHKAQAN